MPTELSILGTKIAEIDQGLRIQITLADVPETEVALNLIQVRLLLDTHEIAAPFVTLQRVTLERARTAIDEEIRRLRQREANAR
jgi:hypothetical protein